MTILAYRLEKTEGDLGIPKLARSQLFRQACAQIWEKAMAPHSWKIPRMEEPGRLQSMGWLRVGHH